MQGNYIDTLNRTDSDLIFSMIPDGSRVLDLGCGDCRLLGDLQRQKGVHGLGVDIDGRSLVHGLAQGLSIYHGDLDEGLADFPDGSYDYVILNQTLQVVKNPLLVIREMLRIGRFGIVGFPNFGYWSLRAGLLFRGRAPKSPALPFEWHDTPNIRVLTIGDFTDTCAREGFRIVSEEYLMFGGWRRFPMVRLLANAFSHIGIFVITRR
jgi:methionine biosynthesis protein MetW